VIPPPEEDEQRVAIITSASQGIGAGLAKAYRECGYAAIATARSIGPSEDPGVVTIGGDIADPDTAQRVVDEAVERFGRIDTLVNKPRDLHRQALHGVCSISSRRPS
jgi:NAD(P)-dependent dehydrogenase (short-subunit alcohol dehydrogenase family)